MPAALKAKHPGESRVEATHIVQPPDINSLGTIFGGQLMAWIDLTAAASAYRHTRRTCVTASMDELHFLHPVQLGDIVILKASVNYTHRTSLEIGVRVEAEKPFSGDKTHVASAYLTFVAVDKRGKPIPVAPVLPETPQEKLWFREGEERRKHRLAWKARRQKERKLAKEHP